MIDAIQAFGDRIERDGVGLFYYAGHGTQVDGINYLVPLGTNVHKEADVEFECVDAGRVLGHMEEAGNRVNIVILDACRNNPFTRSFKRSRIRGLAKMDAARGTILAYATSPGDVAADGDGENGLYTTMLLKHIQRPGLKILDILQEVGKDVAGFSEESQVPWVSFSLVGDFYFVPPSLPPVVSSETELSPVSPPPALVPEKRGGRKTWLWLLVGAAAVGGTGAAVVGAGGETEDGPGGGVPTGEIIIDVPLPE